jgi:transcriptional activator SPT8
MPVTTDSKEEPEPMDMDLGGLESTSIKNEFDVKSDNYEFDDLFDEQPEMDGENKEMVFADEPISVSNTQSEVPLPLGIPTTSWAGAPAVSTDGPPVVAAAPRQNQPVKLAPKMPPLLDASNSPDLSPDLLMTASIDGQVVLWDRRVSADSGRGVGRLTMNSGTPPWCVSVIIGDTS